MKIHCRYSLRMKSKKEWPDELIHIMKDGLLLKRFKKLVLDQNTSIITKIKASIGLFLIGLWLKTAKLGPIITKIALEATRITWKTFIPYNSLEYIKTGSTKLSTF